MDIIAITFGSLTIFLMVILLKTILQILKYYYRSTLVYAMTAQANIIKLSNCRMALKLCHFAKRLNVSISIDLSLGDWRSLNMFGAARAVVTECNTASNAEI